MYRCENEVGELEELITLDVLNHYLYKVTINVFISFTFSYIPLGLIWIVYVK